MCAHTRTGVELVVHAYIGPRSVQRLYFDTLEQRDVEIWLTPNICLVFIEIKDDRIRNIAH